MVKTFFEDGCEQFRLPDEAGNLYESADRRDRTYGSSGQLEKQGKWKYKYDDLGNLIKKSEFLGDTWKYEWNSSGLLDSVIRPDGNSVLFRYDALGRRIEKWFGNRVTRWVWDGNVPLHEWKELHIRDYTEERGEFIRVQKNPVTTWVFEEGTFVPAAKLTVMGAHSIVTNYMGTPEAMYNDQGEQTWSCDLDSYGRVRKHVGNLDDCPFVYQGMYFDKETNLYYNRYRYFDSSTGSYLSQDPIRLAGNNPTLYAYVHDPNSELDIFGLKSNSQILGENLGSGDIGHDAHHLVLAGITKDERITALQKKMKDFNIDINGKENGIWLPRNESFRIDNRTLHKGEGVHSDSYKQYIYDKLIQAKDRKDFLAKLQVAKNELENGKKFKCKT